MQETKSGISIITRHRKASFVAPQTRLHTQIVVKEEDDHHCAGCQLFAIELATLFVHFFKQKSTFVSSSCDKKSRESLKGECSLAAAGTLIRTLYICLQNT